MITILNGGYTSFSSDTLDGIHYYIQDYMGNNRMVVNGQTGATEQVTHYYPYGGVIGDISYTDTLITNDYKFEGKELDRTFGLDWYDIQARQYDAIGVPGWNKPDQLAEKYYGISPYVMCAGNPVNLGDYDGQDVFTISTMGELKKTNTTYGTTLIFYSSSTEEVTNVIKFDADKGFDTALNGMKEITITFAPGLKSESLVYGQMSANQAFELQNIMTINTDVEWSAISTQEGGGMLASSKNTSKVEVGKAMQICGIELKDVNISLHGHPGRNAEDGSTSEGTRGGSSGDMDRVSPGIRYFVNHQETGLIYEYNSTQQCIGTPQTFEEWMKSNLY